MKGVMIQKLSTFESLQSPKNRVIHGVIHVIHKKWGCSGGWKSTKKEQLFCEDIINFARKWKNTRKELTF